MKVYSALAATLALVLTGCEEPQASKEWAKGMGAETDPDAVTAGQTEAAPATDTKPISY